MPAKLKELPKTSRGRAKKYDFSNLYNGDTWAIFNPDDFDCEVQSIRQLIYREVAEMGKSVKSTAIEADGKEGLAFQVVDEPPRKRGPRKTKSNGSDTEKAKAESK